MASNTGVRGCKRAVSVNGETFESVTAFCNAYGLKYPSVSVQLRKGVPPETIIEKYGTLPTTQRYKANARTATPCSYDGVDYPSVSAAADALGIPGHTIPLCMQTKGLSVNEAIKYIMESGEYQTSGGGLGQRMPCVVEGVLYPSRSAACQAYGVKYISVASRMSRNGMTFEEALASGGVARRHIQPMASIWDGLQLSGFVPVDDKDPLFQMGNIFSKICLTPTYLFDSAKGIAALKISTSLHTISEYRDIYFLLQYPVKGTIADIQIILPNLLSDGDEGKPQTTDELNQIINKLNSQYAGVTLVVVDGCVRAVSAMTLLCGNINTRLLIRNYQRFLGTAAAMYDDCATNCLV